MSDMVNALGHQWEDPVCVKPFSCSEDGLQSRICSRCAVTEEETLYHKGHTYVIDVVEGDQTSGKVVYVCSVCQDRIELEQGELLPQEMEEYMFFPDCSSNFSFLVNCEDGPEYVYTHLTIKGADGYVEYTATPEGDAYRISPTVPYLQYESYSAELAGNISFTEYRTKVLQFSIIGPEKATVSFKNQEIVFLKTLELELYGTHGQYELEWDDAAQRYFLTLPQSGMITESMIGKIIAVGDYVSTEDILADGSRDLVFGKIETIVPNADGKLILVLTPPQLSEIFDEYDLYFTGVASVGEFSVDSTFEEEFLSAVVTSDGFAEYVTAMNLAATSYAQEHGLAAIPLGESSANALSFKLTQCKLTASPDSAACRLVLEGTITYTISLKDRNGTQKGTVTLKCVAGIDSTIIAGGQYTDKESVVFYLDNHTTTTLSFELSFDLEYRSEYEAEYLLHKETNKIHTATCRIANNETNPANLMPLTAQELSEMYNGDKETMRAHECKVCLAITGMDGTAYVLNNNTGVLHCMNCRHVSSIQECNVYTIYPDNTTGYTNCQDCRPQDRQVQDFDARMLNAMQGSDWATQVSSIKEELGSSIGEKEPKPETDPNLSVPINIAGVFNIEIGIAPVFSFDIEASASFTVRAFERNVYGIRSVGDGYQTFHGTGANSVNYELTLMGEVDVQLGITLVVKAYPVGCEEVAHIGITGEVGVYGHFSGIFQISGTADGESDSFCAARLEVGLYTKVDGYWKILWFDGDFNILSEQRTPLFKWGYDRVYYSFAEEEPVFTLEEWGENTYCNLAMFMRANYLDLITMKKGTDYISSTLNRHADIEVDIRNTDGSPCDYLIYQSQNGYLVRNEDAPESFSVLLYITVHPRVTIENLSDFFASESRDAVYGYFLDPIVVHVIVGNDNQEGNDNNQSALNPEWEDAVFFNGHYYRVYSGQSSWENATEFCRSVDGHMATITSEEENDFLYNYLISLGLSSAYFGFSDVESEGEWVWCTGEEVVFLDWASGEPNNEGKKEHYCLFDLANTNGQWNDGSFKSGANTYFICEWDNGHDVDSDDAVVYLEDMPIVASDRYTGNMGDSFIDDLGTRNGLIDIYGNVLQHGLEAWIARWNFMDEQSWAWVEYSLDGQYSLLSGRITLIADSYNTEFFVTTLDIIGDGELLYSTCLTPGMEIMDVDVDISNVKTLRIYVYDNIAASGGTSFGLWDFAVSKKEKPDDETIADVVTVRVQIPDNWTNAAAYVWTENVAGVVLAEPLGVWPGSQMTIVDGWYQIQVPVDTTRIIINDNNENAEEGHQTADIAIVPGQDVWILLNDGIDLCVSYGDGHSGGEIYLWKQIELGSGRKHIEDYRSGRT